MQVIFILILGGLLGSSIFFAYLLGSDDWAYRVSVTLLATSVGKLLWDKYERYKNKKDISEIIYAEIKNYRDHSLENIKVLEFFKNDGSLLEAYNAEKLKYLTDIPITIKSEFIRFLPKNLSAEIMRMNVRYRNIDIEVDHFITVLKSPSEIDQKRREIQEKLFRKMLYLWIKTSYLQVILEKYILHVNFPGFRFDDVALCPLSLEQVIKIGQEREKKKSLKEFHENIQEFIKEELSGYDVNVTIVLETEETIRSLLDANDKIKQVFADMQLSIIEKAYIEDRVS